MARYSNMTEEDQRAEIDQYMSEREKHKDLVESILRGDPIAPCVSKTYSIEERHDIMENFMAVLDYKDNRPTYSNDDLLEMKDAFFTMAEHTIEAKKLIAHIDNTLRDDDEKL